MKSYSVKDLMVPLSEYATVTEDATLYDAVLSLEEAQEKFEDKHTRYRHRAILVLDKGGNVTGKLGQLDVLRALEPKYKDMVQGEGSHRYGFTKSIHEIHAGGLSTLCGSFGRNLLQSRGTERQGIYGYAHRGRICIGRRVAGCRRTSNGLGPSPVPAGNPRRQNSRYFTSDRRIRLCFPYNERVFREIALLYSKNV